MIELFTNVSYFWIITILAFLISLISTLAYKYTTDQKKLKRVKEDIKKLRVKQKKHVDNQKKFMEIQKQMMAKNTDLMKESFKPMIYTLLPLLIVFAWMAANLAFQPIVPGDVFSVDIELKEPENVSIELTNHLAMISQNENSWSLRAENTGTASITFIGESFTESIQVLVTETKRYLNPTSTFDNNLRSVNVQLKEVKPLGDTQIFGWRPGWLGTYILISIVFSLVMRKLLRVN